MDIDPEFLIARRDSLDIISTRRDIARLEEKLDTIIKMLEGYA